jgi:hypothetical protein
MLKEELLLNCKIDWYKRYFPASCAFQISHRATNAFVLLMRVPSHVELGTGKIWVGSGLRSCGRAIAFPISRNSKPGAQESHQRTQSSKGPVIPKFHVCTAGNRALFSGDDLSSKDTLGESTPFRYRSIGRMHADSIDLTQVDCFNLEETGGMLFNS